MTINKTFGMDNESLTFPCKYSAANFDNYNPEWPDQYCGTNGLIFSLGSLSDASDVWCGVISTNAEFPSFLSVVAGNLRLKPLFIALIAVGAVGVLWGLWQLALYCYAQWTRRTPSPESSISHTHKLRAVTPETQHVQLVQPAFRRAPIRP